MTTTFIDVEFDASEELFLNCFYLLPKTHYTFSELSNYLDVKDRSIEFFDLLHKLCNDGILERKDKTFFFENQEVRNQIKSTINIESASFIIVKVFKILIQTNEKNDLIEFEEYIEIAESIVEKIKEDEYIIAQIANKLSNYYYAQKKYDISLEYDIKANEIYEKFVPENDITLAVSYNNLALSYARMQYFDKALEYSLYSLSIYNQNVPPNDLRLAPIYSQIGFIYLELEDYERALEYEFKSVAIEKKGNPSNRRQQALGVVYNYISIAYAELKQFSKSLHYAIKSTKLKEEVFEENHPQLGNAYCNLALSYSDMFDFENAKYYIIQATQIHEKTYSEEHPVLKTTRSIKQYIMVFYKLSKIGPKIVKFTGILILLAFFISILFLIFDTDILGFALIEKNCSIFIT